LIKKKKYGVKNPTLYSTDLTCFNLRYKGKRGPYLVGQTTEKVDLRSTSTAFFTVDNLKSTISVIPSYKQNKTSISIK